MNWLEYDMPLWRPPSEARRLILQATIGCSFNRCSFCSMYREKEYRARPLDELFEEIDATSQAMPHVRRVFLADGDAFVLDTDHLMRILERLQKAFPDLQRVSSYAWPLQILKKTPEELALLKRNKLSLIYVGVESGAASMLKKITKGANPDIMARAINRSRESGVKVSATMILGLGGVKDWREHIEGTAELINLAPPNYLSTLQLGLAPEIREEFFRKYKDDFQPQDDVGMLEELELLVRRLSPPKPIIFRSNHASNALPLGGTLPKDGKRLLREIRACLSGDVPTVPGWLRGY